MASRQDLSKLHDESIGKNSKVNVLKLENSCDKSLDRLKIID